jgi:hypothetical protein
MYNIIFYNIYIMATYSGYTFSNMSRIGIDDCCVSQDQIQDMAACNYMTQNYFASDCSMKKPIDLATTQPGIMYNGGLGSGSGGCNIDESSKLLIGSIQTHPKCRIDLFQRPFATVPFLGRGSVNPIIEAQIQQGEQIVNKKSVNNLCEKSYIKYHHAPLLPHIQEKISNPSYSVEGVASQGWIRGGVPSRELTRDADYFNKHTQFQYV